VALVAEQAKRNGWSWPEEPAGPPTRAGRIAGVVFSSMFLIYLVNPVEQVFEEPRSAGTRFAVVAIVVFYGGLYLAVFSRSGWHSRPVRVAAVAVMFVCGIVLAVLLGPDDLVYMTFVIAAALVQLPPMVGLLLGTGVAAALMIGTAAADGAPDWNNVSVLVVLTIALFGTRQVIASNQELRAARDEIATLAVAEERTRMARDLHDVLGHSLTTITVKAGLARRILESSGDGTRAIGELRDVERLSRTALAEVRSTVSGYRKASLPAELVGARVALQAAEITADLPHAVDNVPADLQEPFAYVLREGVTNVIRHSNARRCEVRLGESWIEIRDDGTAFGSDRGPEGGVGSGDGPMAAAGAGRGLATGAGSGDGLVGASGSGRGVVGGVGLGDRSEAGAGGGAVTGSGSGDGPVSVFGSGAGIATDSGRGTAASGSGRGPAGGVGSEDRLETTAGAGPGPAIGSGFGDGSVGAPGSGAGTVAASGSGGGVVGGAGLGDRSEVVAGAGGGVVTGSGSGDGSVSAFGSGAGTVAASGSGRGVVGGVGSGDRSEAAVGAGLGPAIGSGFGGGSVGVSGSGDGVVGVSAFGHGLAGLAERLAKVGGTLSAGPSPAGGFVVRASVPGAVTA
jgi:two-component system sensor histidine kinase DesK